MELLLSYGTKSIPVPGTDFNVEENDEATLMQNI